MPTEPRWRNLFLCADPADDILGEPMDEGASKDNVLRLRLWEHDGSGPVVLFLHGYLDTGRSFDAAVEALGGQVRALCLDWRGHGRSDAVAAGGSYHPLDHLKDLTRVLVCLERAGMVPEALVAHSMGGNLALMMAGAWPRRVRRLLVLDAFGPPPQDPSEQAARLGRALQRMLKVRPFGRFDSRQEATARLRQTNFGLSAQGAERMAKHALMEDPQAPGKWTFRYDPRLKGPTPIRYPEQTWLATFGRITAPVRVLRAQNGYVPLGELLDGRKAAIKDLEVATLDGSYHHLHVEHPDAVAKALRALLAVDVAAQGQGEGQKA